MIQLYGIKGVKSYLKLEKLYHDELLNLFERGETPDELRLWASDENMYEFCGGEVYKLLKKLPAEIRHNYAGSFVKYAWFGGYWDDDADLNFLIDPAEFYFEDEPEEVLAKDIYEDGEIDEPGFELIEQGASNKLIANFGEYFFIELDTHMLAKAVAQYLLDESQELTGEVYLNKQEVVPEFEIVDRGVILETLISYNLESICHCDSSLRTILKRGFNGFDDRSGEELIKEPIELDLIEECIEEGSIKHNR